MTITMSRSLFLCFTIYTLFFSGLHVFGQEFPMLHYTIEEGLPSNNIYDIYRDDKGFLWFTSDKGIARYNGIKFEKFTTFNGLPDNEIFFSQEDNYGRLWFGTYNGELCYYKDDTFHSAANTSFLKLPFKNSFVTSVHLERDKSVTICFRENSIFLNVNKNEISLLNLDNKYFINRPFFYLDISKLVKGGYKVFCSDSTIYINDNCEVTSMEKNYYKNLRISPIQNKRIFYNDDFIFSADMNIIGQFKNHPIGNRLLHRVYFDDRNLFCAYNSGLDINDSLQILGNNNISSVNQDNVGNYWVCTLNDGIYSLNKYFFFTRLLKDVYKSSIVYSCVRNNHLFFTTEDNNLYCLENGMAKCLFDYSKYNNEDTKRAQEPGYFIDSNYKYYIFYNNDNIVIDNVLSEKQKIKRYSNNSLASGIKRVLSAGNNVYIQTRGRIMTIDYGKIGEGDEIGSKFSNVVNEMTHAERIFCMAKARDNSIWYSTINNFYKITDGRGALQSQFKKIPLKYFNFYDEYLIGYTHSNQLLIYGNIEKNLWVDSIQPQNCIWDKFYKLDTSHILISTNNLYRVLTINSKNSEKKMSVAVVENPYIPLQAESICVDSGNCYFFKNGSITSIAIKTLLIKPDPPKLFFGFLKTNKKNYPIHDDLEIPFRESKNISISFSTLSFSGKDVSYQYSVSRNNQDNWREVKGEEINFVNPAYGNYIIKVRAKTISSDYSQPIIYTLHILRPFWASLWFIALCVCLLVAIIGMAIRYRIIYVLRKRERLHESEIRFMKSEYTALNALMNPHFIFNTLNNVQGLVNRNDKLAANEYLRVFADLIRQNMHNISKELIPLQKEIDLVNNYLLLEKLRFKDLLNYTINVSPEIDLSEIMIPPLLVQPLVENSIKHGILPLESVEGFININVYENNGILHIEVKDNGIGMSASQSNKDSLHESFGLENIKKRIKQLSIIQNKEITFHVHEIKDDEGKPQWTIVSINIPIG